ncbi:hypothetical protein [Marilutibacter aestuarii]|uniref:Uncharacterized protein n=1 Tax=Marilutibacter aestuarii TaxID=1706195 RepID=A0A508APT6_9GAMM|nr:hypothetical protein [Lysobacter aestuarii]TQD51749.1 hypothetical protein FKV25_00310 [Lysobacter aestuarii]
MPAGTAVDLEITDTLGSDTHVREDLFGLRLAAPLVVGGTEVVPAGVAGVGQVVHADAARGGGAPGELLIAARHLELACGPLPLRGLKLGVTGGDNSGMAVGVSLAAGPFAMFIRGHEIQIPAGTRVTARLARDLEPGADLACAVATTPAPEQVTPDAALPASPSNPTPPTLE